MSQHTHGMKYLVVVALVFWPFSAFSQDGALKVGGFVDGQYQHTKVGSNDSGTFGVYDGAVYVSKQMGNGGAHLDLAIDNGSGVSSLGVGGAYSQAYVHFMYDNGLSWRLGQFDSIYGFEANDTVDIAFTRQGALFSLFQPKTHTGLMVGYDLSGAALKFILSNPNGSTTMSGSNPEFGVQLKLNPGGLSAGVGALFNKQGGEMTYLVDAVVGMEMGSMLLNFQADLRKPTTGDNALGFMLHGINSFTDMVKGGARLEYVKDIAGADSIFLGTVGPQFKMTDALTTKVDYTFSSTKPDTGAASETGHSGTIAAVYRF